MRTSFRRAAPLLAAGILLFGLTGAYRAQDEGAGDGRKKLNDQLHDVLRTVINRGADLYNNSRDYAGCYRLYHGALLTVRPLLEGYPDLQSAIDAGIRNAEGIQVTWQKAFALREVLDRIRGQIGRGPGGGEKKIDDKKVEKVEDKKAEDKKEVEKPKKDDDKKDDDKAKKDEDKAKKDEDKGKKDEDKVAVKSPLGALVSGTVKHKGQPLTSGYVTFVGKDKQRFSASILPDGAYRFKKVSVPPGDYTVLVEEDPGREKGPRVIPARYSNPEMSPLTATLEKGANNLDLELD
jgi:hypothetical protein